MSRTVFEHPLLRPPLVVMSKALLKLSGWRIEGVLAPQARRCVVIAAPHTSNWDFPYTLMGAMVLGMHIRWLGKASLFRFPFGGLMRWLGGMAVQRDRSNNLVAASVAALQAAPGPLQLVIAPEGTRSHTAQWKAGFHHIARGAGLPIQLSYLDWGRRCMGLGPLVEPGEDVEGDIARIRAFYAPFKGRHPAQFDAG